MATAIYMRVSTQQQEETGVSLNTQKERLQAYCTMKGYSNVKEYLDVGSGRTTDKRVNFNRMIDDIENNFISNVVILRLDRLTRSIIDLNKLVSQLNENGCALHSCTENIDTTTASGRMMINLIGTFAQWESETISERVKINMQSLSEKGIWQSAVPYGFTLGDDKRLVIDEKEKDILNEAFDLVIEGSSFAHAEVKTSEKYHANWYHGFLLKKLRSPSTIGDMYRNGNTTKDTHLSLIDESKYNKLITIADERSAPRTQIFDGDLFRRKVLCPNCSQILSLRANKSTKDNRNLYSYSCHHCFKKTGKIPNISEAVINEAFIRYLDRYTVNYSKDDTFSTNDKKEITKLENEVTALESEKKRIQVAWIKGFMEDEELMEYQKEVDEKVIAAENKLKSLSKNDIEITDEEIIMLNTTLKENYSVMTKEEKILFIQTHIKEIHISRKLLKGYKQKYKVNVTSIVFY